MTSERVDMIRSRLEREFSPVELRVKDQSHLHAGHAGAKDGLGHFDVFIVSDAFNGLSRIQCHQRIYAAMGTLMQTDIHALSIRANGTDQ
ncbi:MAG: BolA family protein [Pseudomonadota bacterium]